MNTSGKIAVAAFLGSLGLAGLALTTDAAPSFNNILVAQERESETDDDAEDRQEAARLQPLAKITPQQARQAAEATQGGTASSVELGNEDGNLVYEVTIGQTEVIVDAGNGKVLWTENVNQEDDEATEAARPRSSIQVPKNDDDK